LCFEF